MNPSAAMVECPSCFPGRPGRELIDCDGSAGFRDCTECAARLAASLCARPPSATWQLFAAGWLGVALAAVIVERRQWQGATLAMATVARDATATIEARCLAAGADRDRLRSTVEAVRAAMDLPAIVSLRRMFETWGPDSRAILALVDAALATEPT